ncbi:unnamed protein product, partial [Urochloa humidicola]
GGGGAHGSNIPRNKRWHTIAGKDLYSII